MVIQGTPMTNETLPSTLSSVAVPAHDKAVLDSEAVAAQDELARMAALQASQLRPPR
jgi:hypothetical protein